MSSPGFVEISRKKGRIARCGSELSAKIKTTKAAQAEESEEDKVSDIRSDISRWALDSASRQGEIAAMFLNPRTRQGDKDDVFAVVYAKRSASAALFFLGREPEEGYVGIPNVSAIVHTAERFRNFATTAAEEILQARQIRYSWGIGNEAPRRTRT